MQTNGIGSSHSDMHHVTNCIHNHKHRQDTKVGPMSSVGGTEENTNQPAITPVQQEEFSLSAWLQDTLSGAKRFLGKVWGGESTISQAQATGVQEAAKVGTNGLNTSQIEAASVVMQEPRNVNKNPYFTAVQEPETPGQTFWQKVKVRFRDITGFMAKGFSFAGSGAFQTKQEQPKEDLRRHSRYRKDDVEIDCVLTDESYLMDSYNKKGEYSKLSADK